MLIKFKDDKLIYIFISSTKDLNFALKSSNCCLLNLPITALILSFSTVAIRATLIIEAALRLFMLSGFKKIS